MFDKVKKTLIEHHLIEKNDYILIGLSGGADSVCLFHLFRHLSSQLSFTFACAHINHGLRGEEAEKDQAFCQNLCQTYNIPFYVTCQNVKDLAQKQGIGVEEAGREVRYNFFYTLQKEQGFTKIATAHHKDDDLETVLMHLLRGTSPMGMAGIPYKNGAIIRPLLNITKNEIISFLESENYLYRTDSTNNDTNFTRNRIRHQLIPEIEAKFNSNFRNNFADTVNKFKELSDYLVEETEEVYKRTVEPFWGGYTVDIKALSQEKVFMQKNLLYRVVSSVVKDSTSKHIDLIIKLVLDEKGRVDLPGDFIAEICHKKLYIRKDKAIYVFSGILYPNEPYYVKECDVTFIFETEKTEKKQNILWQMPILSEMVDGKTLQVRSRKKGDFFFPKGMEGSKKIQDLFTDLKIPRFLRDSIPIVAADDDIVWVVGYREDRRFFNNDKGKVPCITVCKGDTTYEKFRSKC